MAEEESQGAAAPEVPAGGPPPVPEAGGSKLVPIIIVVVLLLITVGGVAFYFLGYSNNRPAVEATSEEEAKFIEQYNLRSQPSVDTIKRTEEPIFTRSFSYALDMKDGITR